MKLFFIIIVFFYMCLFLFSAVEVSNESSIFIRYNIKPGEKKTISIDLPGFASNDNAVMEVSFLRGIANGPLILVIGGIHGDELTGAFVCQEVFKNVDPKKLKGEMILIHHINVYGLERKSRYYPDRRDLNKCFPGIENGSLASSIAFFICNEFINKADLVIDLHSGSDGRTNFPQIRADFSDPIAKKIAIAFNAPLTLDAKLKKGTCREYCYSKKIPAILYEAGKQLEYYKFGVERGLKGILSVADNLKMIKSDQLLSDSIVLRKSFWIRAPMSGLLISYKNSGDRVKENEELGEVRNISGTNISKIISSKNGIIIGFNTEAPVYSGDAIYHIGILDDN